jgi:hypothetical protein
VHDGVGPLRTDGTLQDGDGGPYWLLSVGLPGFRMFRYPGKLLTFACLALAALAGLGWDQLAAGNTGRTRAWARALLMASLGLLAAFLAGRGRLAAWMSSGAAGAGSALGPLDVDGALSLISHALVHGTLVLGMVLELIRLAPRFPRAAAALALVLVTLDLAVASAPLVYSLPQGVFDARPELLDVIDRAERAQPAPGPFRVYRVPHWDPVGWFVAGAPDRNFTMVQWRRKTLEAKYGLPFGIEYAFTAGTAELDAYQWFFHPLPQVVTAKLADALRAERGSPLIYYPRRGLDLWNSRYFIVPFYPRWGEANRGIAALLADFEIIAPDPTSATNRDESQGWDEWVKREDWLVVRNRAALPRAWVVHQARRLPPAPAAAPLPTQARLREILYPGDAFWTEPGRQVYDPRAIAWAEPDTLTALAEWLAGGPPDPRESVAVRYPSPQRVELVAHLERPGVVVLADVDYPGWQLTVDDKPATIHRVNGLMRGAAVGAGTHRLAYVYTPGSFRLGLALTVGALVTCAGLWVWWRRC